MKKILRRKFHEGHKKEFLFLDEIWSFSKVKWTVLVKKEF